MIGIIKKSLDWLKAQPDCPQKDWVMGKMTRYEKSATRPRNKVFGQHIKAVSLSTIRRKLDKVFSEYVRRVNANEYGSAQCVTCGLRYPWKDMDCGHFMSRGFLPTRYDLKNTGPQCKKCNRFQEGRHHDFAKSIDRRHGEGTADRINVAAKRFAGPNRFALEAMLKEYGNKLKEMDGTPIKPMPIKGHVMQIMKGSKVSDGRSN